MLKPLNDELYHFGVRGQRKGNRRYQYLDGTWTELGKERRRKGTGERSAIDKEDDEVYNSRYGGLDPEVAKAIAPAVVVAACLVGGYALNKYVGDADIAKITADMLGAGYCTKNTTFLSKKPNDNILELSKETGLKLKTKESYVPQDLKNCNIDCRNDKDMSCRNNCGCSSIAYYLRRNGLDVVAKPSPNIDAKTGKILGLDVKDMDSVFIGFKDAYEASNVDIFHNSYCGHNTESYMELLSKRIHKLSGKEDSFGIIGSAGWDEHWFAWEKHGDEILLIDPQRGNRIERTDEVFSNIANDGSTWIDCVVRVDNLPINKNTVTKYVQNM